jgi:CHAD domain-containing protein
VNVKPHRETEIKLLAGPTGLDVHAVRRTAESTQVALDDGRTAERRDVYLDDAGFHLGRAGVGLRIRRHRRQSILGLKVERAGHGRVHERDELELEVDPSQLPKHARDLPGPFRDRVEPLIFDAALRPAVVLRVERTTHQARANGSTAEVCLDRVATESPHGDAIGMFDELEIEIPPDASRAPWLEWADRLRADAGMTESRLNKLQRGLELARGGLPTPETRRVSFETDLREAARIVLVRHFRRMQREEIRTRTTGKLEGVHKLRVACRRMRAIFEIFAASFAPGEVDDFVQATRRTGRAFNDVRDLDVLVERLDRDLTRLPQGVLKHARRLVARLRSGREELFRDACKALRKRRRLAGCAALQRWLEQPGSEAVNGSSRVADGAPELIWQAAREVFARGQRIRRNTPAEHLHALRIATKRLRYTAEAFLEVYGRDLERFVERTTHLQEVLGAFQDADVGVARLEALAGIEGLSRKELIAIGAWMALEQERGRQAREAFESVWAEFDTDDLRTYLGAALRAPA